MRIPIEFSSPITKAHIKNTPSKSHGQLIKQLENTKYALGYYLEKTIPKGGTICLLYPKTILRSILPEIAERKKCRVICVGAETKLTQELMEKGILEQKNTEPDIYLTEPDGICQDGAIVRPQETETLKQYKTYAITSTLQWTEKTPPTHDCVEVYKTITEKGIMRIDSLLLYL